MNLHFILSTEHMGPFSMLSDVYITLGDCNTLSVLLQFHYLVHEG